MFFIAGARGLAWTSGTKRWPTHFNSYTNLLIEGREPALRVRTKPPKSWACLREAAGEHNKGSVWMLYHQEKNQQKTTDTESCREEQHSV